MVQFWLWLTSPKVAAACAETSFITDFNKFSNLIIIYRHNGFVCIHEMLLLHFCMCWDIRYTDESVTDGLYLYYQILCEFELSIPGSSEDLAQLKSITVSFTDCTALHRKLSEWKQHLDWLIDLLCALTCKRVHPLSLNLRPFSEVWTGQLN